MKRKSTKKITVCTVIMCAALCFCACGENEAETPDANVSENPASDEVQGQEIDAPEENTESAVEDEGQADDMNISSKNDTSVIDSEFSVAVVMESADDIELTTDDGTVFYTVTCSYPVVSISGNEAAAEKINADIRSRVEAYNAAAEQSAKLTKEDFEYMLNDADEGYTPMPYSSELSFTVTRADNNVISFTENGYKYTGGAHGMPYTTGINYDTNTGELITFTDLGDDPDAFRADTLAYNQELAQTEYYSMQLFNTDDITNGTMEEVLYADGGWYLSTSGLVFMSPPYALAPYAAGTLEFTIPYSELANMGFNEQYTYTGRQIVKLMENEPYSTDLNGDGSEESVVYNNEWVTHDDGSFDILTHLSVNDTDYAQSGTDDVREQLTSSVGSQLSVYDLDVNDNYVELAAVFIEWTQNDGDANPVATRYSRLFRYMEDGSLIYLGQVDGDVTDPSVSFSPSDLQSDS